MAKNLFDGGRRPSSLFSARGSRAVLGRHQRRIFLSTPMLEKADWGTRAILRPRGSDIVWLSSNSTTLLQSNSTNHCSDMTMMAAIVLVASAAVASGSPAKSHHPKKRPSDDKSRKLPTHNSNPRQTIRRAWSDFQLGVYYVHDHYWGLYWPITETIKYMAFATVLMGGSAWGQMRPILQTSCMQAIIKTLLAALTVAYTAYSEYASLMDTLLTSAMNVIWDLLSFLPILIPHPKIISLADSAKSCILKAACYIGALLHAPIFEELFFRLLPDKLLRRCFPLEHPGNSDSTDGPNQQQTRIAEWAVCFMSSFLFATAHIGNWYGENETMTAKLSGLDLNYPEEARLAGCLAQCFNSFHRSQFVFMPLCRQSSVWASIGAHAYLNLLARIPGGDIPILLAWLAVHAIRSIFHGS